MSGHIIEPLLYIDQPAIQKPKAIMQDYYYNAPLKEQLEEQLVDELTNGTEKEKIGSFKDLLLDKKVDYLLDLPEGFPQIRCEFITKKRSYRGILLEQNEKDLIVRVLGRENVTLNKKDLMDIQMLGF